MEPVTEMSHLNITPACSPVAVTCDIHPELVLTKFTMATPSSPRRAQKLKRRFSSASSGGTWPSRSGTFPMSLASASSISRARGRQTSMTPLAGPPGIPYTFLRPNLTDASELEEDYSDSSSHGRSVASDPHIFRARSHHQPMIYASLPPTPISPSPSRSPTPVTPLSPLSPTFTTVQPPITSPFSLWDYLREELLATDFDSHQELKWERVSNFLSIPLAIEKVCLLKAT